MTRKLLGGLAALFLVLTAGAAQATLIGSEVNVSAYFPNTTSVFSNPGNRIVSGAVEYAAGSYPTYNPSWEIDIGANQLTITDTLSRGLPFASASFNGWILEVISGPSIVSASVDASSTIVPFALSVVGGELLMNFQGVNQLSGGTAVINFVTENGGAVPEPGSMAIFALGLLALGFAMRRRTAGART